MFWLRLMGAVVALVAVIAVVSLVVTGSRPAEVSEEAAPRTSLTSTTVTTGVPPPTTLVPAEERSLELVDIIGGDIAAKSIVTTAGGLVFAQNMMYRHTMTVYDAQHSLLRTIDDQVDLAAFGVEGGVIAQGAPVEAASSSDGRFVYVSNYAMYGDGFGEVPEDSCVDTDGDDDSFVYRVSTDSLEIDQVIAVGAVPKFLAVSPDDQTMLVANWCSFDLSVVDLNSGVETRRIPIGSHPRGIEITSSGDVAYVAAMGTSEIAVVDLERNKVTERLTVGDGPRHLVLSPDERFLYATLNRENRVVKIDLSSKEVVERLETGVAPRTMDISAGGDVLYVVNYGSNTMTKVLTSDFSIAGSVDTGNEPIGVTYHPDTGEVWVSNYSDGTIQVFADAPTS